MTTTYITKNSLGVKTTSIACYHISGENYLYVLNAYYRERNVVLTMTQRNKSTSKVGVIETLVIPKKQFNMDSIFKHYLALMEKADRSFDFLADIEKLAHLEHLPNELEPFKYQVGESENRLYTVGNTTIYNTALNAKFACFYLNLAQGNH